MVASARLPTRAWVQGRRHAQFEVVSVFLCALAVLRKYYGDGSCITRCSRPSGENESQPKSLRAHSSPSIISLCAPFAHLSVRLLHAVVVEVVVVRVAVVVHLLHHL